MINRRYLIPSIAAAAVLGGAAAAILEWHEEYEAAKAIEEKLQNRTVEAVLTATSALPTPDSIAPYDEALVVFEYRVEDVIDGQPIESDTIRVAHWAVVASNQVEVANTIGAARTLTLTPFDMLAEAQSLAVTDDLPPSAEIPLFLDQTQTLDQLHMPDELRFDYRGKFSDQMRIFWEVRPQLKLVIIGNSHAGMGTVPSMFYPTENSEAPVAISLTNASADFRQQNIIVDEYVERLPKLEWVVWGLSPRLFNENYRSAWRTEFLKESLGFQFDQENEDELWPIAPASPENAVPVSATDELSDRVDPWAGTKRFGTKLDFPSREALAAHIRNKCDDTDFNMDGEVWKLLRETLGDLRTRGASVLLFIPPMHPEVAGAEAADNDKTGWDDLEDIVERLEEIDAEFDNVAFANFHRNGRHGIPASSFWDVDHLNYDGAQELTRRIIEVIARTDPEVAR